MADFKKRITGGQATAILDPLAIYEGLDRAHDKGPLRPAQIAILKEWHAERRKLKDVIVKLHTGQGKTLIGLLMLQSRLHEARQPVIYLCPDNLLVKQTCTQARQFGIATCQATEDLPASFTDGKSILVTSVYKLFNGKTIFGLRNESIAAHTVLLDDAHTCSDVIRDQCRIIIPGDDPAFQALQTLFRDALEQQGTGTFADIENGKATALLPVPYWAWTERVSDVARILSNGSDRNTIKFAWPIIKDLLEHCQCMVSGTSIEIEPYIPPLADFGTYWTAPHRIFMSATVTDDAFLIRGLGLKEDVILNPLTYANESWSGEKMILIPSMIDDSLTRSEVVSLFAKPNAKRTSGVVALVPSFKTAENWKSYGAKVASTKTIAEHLDDLEKGYYEHTLVLANRYDGIDLPDDTCRILVLDGKPHSPNLMDQRQDMCRPLSKATLTRTIRTIEQGMGRSVRGEKDYSVIIVVGTELVRLIRDPRARRFPSPQMAAQVRIGLETADLAKQDIESGSSPEKALRTLINQCIYRDRDWKLFYTQEMDQVKPRAASKELLALFAAEFEAEKLFIAGKPLEAGKRIQSLIDSGQIDSSDRPWYIQELSRYNYHVNRNESRKQQLAAFTANRALLRPQEGVTVTPLTLVGHGRVERIIAWMKRFEAHADLEVTLSDILARLAFGVEASLFESALNELSEALGFVGERPDNDWKEGPDNLWALGGGRYILWECKSEVDVQRIHINKRETEQMNRSCAWFEKHYPNATVTNVIIHPARTVESAGAFTHSVVGMRAANLTRFVKQIRAFFKAFANDDLQDLSTAHVQEHVDESSLSTSAIAADYYTKLRDSKE